MPGIKAGVILVSEFCTAGNALFTGYINYMDRDEAIRNVHTEDYNIYQDYMGNPEKTTGLFDEKKELTQEDKSKVKEVFKTAQKNGSLMWQTVISFDNRWLKENGIYDGYLNRNNERKIQEVTRAAVSELLKKENLENAVWTAAIHLNTDNIHVHIAIVEPVPMRAKKMVVKYETYQKGKSKEQVPVHKQMEYRGKFKLSSIEACKRVVVNEIMDQREMNLRINRIIRENIMYKREEMTIQRDDELKREFLKIHEKLPLNVSQNMRKYNSVAMRSIRDDIDRLTRLYIEKYHKDEYERLRKDLERQDALYRTAYGRSEKSFREGKEKDLYTRMGNVILRELYDYERAKKREESKRIIPGISREESGHRVIPIPENIKGDNLKVKSLEEAKSLVHRGDFSSAERILVSEMESGNVLAAVEMGNLYRNGCGRKPDMEMAQRYYKYSFRGLMQLYGQDNGKMRPYISYQIARHYQEGLGVAKDSEQAIRWFENAAREGNMQAAYKQMAEIALQKGDMEMAKGYLEKAGKATGPQIQGGETVKEYLRDIEESRWKAKDGHDRETTQKHSSHDPLKKGMEEGEEHLRSEGMSTRQGRNFMDTALKTEARRSSRPYRSRRGIIRNLKQALDNEYESYRNQKEYERIRELQQKENAKGIYFS